MNFETHMYLCRQVLWSGRVVEDDAKVDESTRYLKALNRKLASDPRINVSLLNVGDGTTLAFKL